eukprot:TRINITY_DN7397_c0_g1_i1.p1 TRINITY_DN7397_c0_g1~~TRINITY_DN7397_c0_g1_i1.p1  ORF type:complete len:115 (-),score=22.15 TRINITY_DN7397_c0_g1_i1:223-567(-)
MHRVFCDYEGSTVNVMVNVLSTPGQIDLLMQECSAMDAAIRGFLVFGVSDQKIVFAVKHTGDDKSEQRNKRAHAEAPATASNTVNCGDAQGSHTVPFNAVGQEVVADNVDVVLA